MNVDLILLTYGEPPAQKFWDQWQYSNRILYKLTRLVAPIPKFLVPVIGAKRGRERVKTWRKHNYSSPLEEITLQQSEAIQNELNNRNDNRNYRVHVTYEFRSPDLKQTLGKLEDKSCDALLFLPMYLPISDFTTSICERDYLQYINTRPTRLPQPRTLVFRPKAKELANIMANHIRNFLAQQNIDAEKRKEHCLILGCHGTVLNPPSQIKDSGYCDTKEMYDQIEKRLRDQFKAINIAWMNHTIGGEWTSPDINESIAEMRQKGMDKFVYYPFGFVADNAESQLEGRMAFHDAGIKDYIHIPCVNDSPEFVSFVCNLVQHHADEALLHHKERPIEAA